METLHRKNSSGEAFSFPCTPSPSSHEYQNQQQDDISSNFEFGFITPDHSPANINIDSSPADHLFFNGKLLPHVFPFNPIINNNINISSIVMDRTNTTSRTTSRTSSINSKDNFLMSSRSNSTNSRSSSCSSSSSSTTTARTSLSDHDNSERKFWEYQRRSRIVVGNYKSNRSSTTSVAAQVYGCSKKWQIMTPVLPAGTLSRESSRRSKRGLENNYVVVDNIEKVVRRTKKEKRTVVVKPIKLGLRFFRWFVSSCKECHAIEPSSRKL